ncbi:MAG: hypothetical protein KF864_03020 [Phycisphaeraceae bacterium]|nr:hypothetical protein [Phycisphaeraceae bacterium]
MNLRNKHPIVFGDANTYQQIVTIAVLVFFSLIVLACDQTKGVTRQLPNGCILHETDVIKLGDHRMYIVSTPVPGQVQGNRLVRIGDNPSPPNVIEIAILKNQYVVARCIAIGIRSETYYLIDTVAHEYQVYSHQIQIDMALAELQLGSVRDAHFVKASRLPRRRADH